jgi:hypothetical protein
MAATYLAKSSFSSVGGGISLGGKNNHKNPPFLAYLFPLE